MLKYDPIPWLLAREGESAVRARRSLGLKREGDSKILQGVLRRLRRSQLPDGSFAHSPMKTAGVVCLLADLASESSAGMLSRAAEFLFGVLQSQPGYDRARQVRPGMLTTPCDLAGLFGPYEARAQPHVLAHGAREMNFYREYEPLLGPKSPVRARRRSSRDRPGPGSCYAWGLIPLSYIIVALCRGGFHAEARLTPAVNALLGAQRRSGGWCRNLGGAVGCSIHAVRALGAHPELRRTEQAGAALEYVRTTQPGGSNLFAVLKAVGRFDLPPAHEILAHGVSKVARRQRRNGSFGTPCPVERVAAVLAAWKRLGH